MNSRNIPRFILILPMMLALLAGSSFWNLAAAQSHETEVFYEVGMKYRFPDGSEGVVCYVDPDNPHRGWAVALEDLKEGKIDALVTSPVNNATIKLGDGATLKSQTAYIEEVAGEGKKALKIFIADHLRIALATDKIPVSEIPAHINKDALAERLVILHNTLKRDFFIDNPRIAVLALNPHADGKEEQEIIAPVIDELFKRGVRCIGPYAAEDFFGSGNYNRFDAVFAMYYDQGVSAFKSIAQNDGINFTAGLPVIRTAPAIGVCYDLAGKNMIEDEQSFRQAIYTAVDVARNRTRFDKERVNPLQKQYVSKRDDSDKLKLDQVTEEDN